VYSHALKKFVDFAGMSPEELVDLGRGSPEDAHDLLKVFYNRLNLASTTKMVFYQALRSFYRANGVVLGRKPRTYRSMVEYEPRRLYSQDEVAWLVDAADNTRDKALITFLAQSGQRVSVVVSLRIGHMNFNQPSPMLVDVPAVLRDRHGVNVNKAQTPYQFALGEDTKMYLKLMIRERVERGEPLSPESWLFRSCSERLAGGEVRKVKLSKPGKPLSVAQVGNIVRDAAEKRGIQQRFGKRYLFHPHGFRRYWKHQLRMGGVDPDLLDYMMGHVLPYGGAYDRWTPEDIRRQYKRAEKYVSLRPVVTVTKEDVQAEVLKVLLGKMDREDVERISENLGIPSAQILSLIRCIGKEE
jgi:integrase/recombinase XerD